MLADGRRRGRSEEGYAAVGDLRLRDTDVHSTEKQQETKGSNRIPTPIKIQCKLCLL